MEKTYLKEVGERLKKCRNRNFFSRRELAEIAQVPISSVIMMEQGEKAVGIEDAMKICKALDYSVEYILTGKCGLPELIRLNQKIIDAPNLYSENLQKIAQAFWSTCPKSYR